ncbi:hypothetical protein DBV15_13024 [Temnothorax longispinosus]|uniref:Uncharacterized protein n=1 Tax=Temnothorax longispinosus TaxID=300112 RepID=A0A4S2KXZ9_9HYME|nr:hypothetical protein DBV15_13024 [Temnothorax longispinosus]
MEGRVIGDDREFEDRRSEVREGSRKVDRPGLQRFSIRFNAAVLLQDPEDPFPGFQESELYSWTRSRLLRRDKDKAPTSNRSRRSRGLVAQEEPWFCCGQQSRGFSLRGMMA